MTHTTILAAFILGTSVACGGARVTAESHESIENPLFSVRGTVTQGLLEAPPDVAQEVGVLWLNLLDDNSEVLVEATPADVIGTTLPAAFDVSVLRAPTDRMLGTALISYREDGGSEQPVDRNRVAFGVVVVAPTGTFASLPTSVTMAEFISSSNAAPGPLLQQFTYVSPFTVRYVKGATAEQVTIRDINGVESVLTDFTVFDVGNWSQAIENLACRDRELGEGWGTDEVKACISSDESSNAAAVACRQACGTPSEGAGEEELQATFDCQLSCPPERSSQDIQNGCLYAWSETQQGAVEATCGPRRDGPESDFRNARRFEPGAAMTLPLGDGDIRKALTVGGFIFLG